MLGPYRIVSAIGAGGMGEVFRATDTKLGRDVAIKVLPESLASDRDRRARFEREAQALAALNHFNIAQIYGLQDDAIVMELLEGETLRARLASGPVPVRKAIEYGAQIARGLAAAHDRGVIHRDVKPENVFIVNDGHIKILDFGLSKHDDPGANDAAQTAQLSTAPGIVMGTAGYMSPEQVRGLRVDARTDVFSLGTVLYEMLSGQRPFRKDSHIETMTAILNDDPPDVSSMRAEVNPALDRIVRHCLEKNVAERFQSARDIAFALDSLSGSASAVAADAKAAPRRSIERVAWAVITTALGALLAWSLLSAPPSSGAPATRTIVTLPEDVDFNDLAVPGSRLSASPDGSRVAIAGRSSTTGQPAIYVVSLDGTKALTLPETAPANFPFWSNDGRMLYMFTGNGLFRQALDGSSPTLVSRQLRNAGGGSANPNGDVLAGGEEVRVLSTRSDTAEVLLAAKEGTLFAVPQFLDDGRRFVVWSGQGPVGVNQDVDVMMGSIDSKSATVVMHSRDISKIAVANDALVFGRGTDLFAQRLSGDPPRLSGEPVQLAPEVNAAVGRGMAFSVSRNGVLVYQATAARPPVRLTWVDRAGKVLSTAGDDGDYSNIELSPDGRTVLASLPDPSTNTRDIYLVDLARGVRQRLTNDPSDERSAIWSPDGRRIIYASKGQELYERATDGSGAERPFVKDGLNKDPYDWSDDGKWVLYRTLRNGSDLWVAPADGSGPGHAVAESRFAETSGNFSPDGKHVVYTSDESGQPDVYVVNLDGTGKLRISTAGGAYPRWRHDGREIVYLSNSRMLMSVDVTNGSSLTVSAPRALFHMNATQSAGPVYDISADGTRFLVAAPVPSRIPPSITVITNWPQLLTRK